MTAANLVSRLRRRAGVLAAAGLIGLAATGCAEPGDSAAVVGGVRIAETQVQQQAQAVFAEGFAESVLGANRDQTTAAIRHELLRRAGAEAGVQVDDATVNEIVGGDASSQLASLFGVTSAELPTAVHDLLLLQELLQKQPPTGMPVTDVSITYDGVALGTRDEAVALRVAALRDPAAFDAKRATVAANEAVQGSRASLLTNPELARYGLYAADAGDVVLIEQGTRYLVVRVAERSEAPGVLNAETLAAFAQQPQQLLALGSLMLGPTAKSAGVAVNPRFGQWDPLTLHVVPSV